MFSKSLSVIPAPSISESEEHSRLPTLDEDEDILTLDQSFAARQYSGSFRLKFSTRESIVGKEGLAATVGEPEPIRTDSSQELNLEDGPELNCSSEEELQEVSLKFTTEGEHVVPHVDDNISHESNATEVS